MASKLRLLPVALFVCLVLSACESGGSNRDEAKLREIEQLWTRVPVYPGMVEVRGSSVSSPNEAQVSKDYQSGAFFDEVKRFYEEPLAQAGWQMVADREVKDRGRNKGERRLEFRRGEYQLDIKYAGERSADSGWNYSIVVDWHER